MIKYMQFQKVVMMNFESDLLKAKFDKASYEKFKHSVNNIYWDCLTKYSYLNIKKEIWEKLLNSIITKLLKSKIKPIDYAKNIKIELNDAVIDFIKIKIAKNQTYFINNILLELKTKYKNSIQILRELFNILNKMHITLTDNFYEAILKQEKLFVDLLNDATSIPLNLKDLKAYLKDYYDVFIISKPFNLDYNKNKQLCIYIANLMDIPKYLLINPEEFKEKNREMFNKFHFLVSNYNNLKYIKEICLQIAQDITDLNLDRVIFSLPLNKINDLLIAFYEYQNKYNKDNTFIYDLITKARTTPIKVISKKPKESKPKNDNDIYLLYKEFPADTISKDKRNEIVNILKNCLPKDRLINLLDYLNGNLTNESQKSQAEYDLNILTKRYNEYLETQILNKRKIKNLYNYFYVGKYAITSEKEKIVNKIFKELPIESQKLIENYLNGEYPRDSISESAALDELEKMKKIYDELYNNYLSNIYNRFRDVPNISFEEKKKIIDILFNNLSDSDQENLKKYLQRKLISNSKEGRRASYCLNLLTNQYEEYLTSGKIPKKVRKRNLGKGSNIYERINPDYTPEDKKIIDLLIESLPEINKSAIYNYQNGDQSNEIIHSYLIKLKNKYLKIYNLALSLKGITLEGLYNHFKNVKGVDLKTKKEVIDSYINEFPHQDKIFISLYKWPKSKRS